jgi:hypothetical protein
MAQAMAQVLDVLNTEGGSEVDMDLAEALRAEYRDQLSDCRMIVRDAANSEK